MKSQVLFYLAIGKNVVIMRGVWQRSSVVEQRNHNPLVGGPNPSAATRINKRPDGSFFYSVRRDEGQPAGGSTRRQKADGSMPVCNANLPRGMKRSGINPSAATRISRFFRDFFIRVICPNLCDFATLRRCVYIYWTQSRT